MPNTQSRFLNPTAHWRAALLATVIVLLSGSPVSYAKKYELVDGHGVEVCDYVAENFENGSLGKRFLKQHFVKNGLYRVDVKEAVPSIDFNALVVEQAQGTRFNVYIEIAPSSFSQETLEFLNTVEFIEHQKKLFVLENITTKKLDSQSVVHEVWNRSFRPVCRFR